MLKALDKEVYAQLQAQLGKDIFKTPMGIDILKQALPQFRDQIKKEVLAQLEVQLGVEFFKTQEGKDILQQLSALMSP